MVSIQTSWSFKTLRNNYHFLLTLESFNFQKGNNKK